jgi:hypothetical protein
MYRGAHGAKCAVGVLIPDSEYDPKIEGLGVKRIAEDKIVHLSILDGASAEDIWFLNDLQTCHDTAYDFENMKLMLIDLAGKRGLQIPT